jgi:membrane protease YdiL (CAAX protease family)
MESIIQPSQTKVNAFPRLFPWLLIFSLLLLRYLSGWFPYLFPGSSPWVTPAFQIGTYGLIALFLWSERGHLVDFHFDRLAIFIFLFFKIVYPLILPFWLDGVPSVLAFPHVLGFAFWLIALLLWIAIRTSYASLPKLRPANWGWLIFGGLFGIAWGFVVVFLIPGWISPQNVAGSTPLLLAVRFPVQMGSAAINEEPLFRGLLWGLLRRAGWKEIWICLFQAVLFTFAHGGLFLSAFSVPWLLFYLAGGLAFGWIVWKSRSIAASMTAHAVFNTASVLVGLLSVTK